MNACPKCGSDEGYTARLPMIGRARECRSWGGTAGEAVDFSHVIFVEPVTVRCSACGHRAPNPRFKQP